MITGMDREHVSVLSIDERSALCKCRIQVEDLSHRSVMTNVESEKRALKKQTRQFKQTVMLVELLMLSETIMQKTLKLQEESRNLLAFISDENSTDVL